MSSAATAREVELTRPAAVACFKGRDTARLLQQAGVELPVRPNSWRSFGAGAGGWCLRLGAGEYLLAHDTEPRALEPLLGHVAAQDTACYGLLRADRCIHLRGPRATELLLQACDIDERLLQRQPDALALVMLADVGVALHGDGASWRIWCDPSYADHVLETFARIDARFHALTPPHLKRQDP